MSYDLKNNKGIEWKLEPIIISIWATPIFTFRFSTPSCIVEFNKGALRLPLSIFALFFAKSVRKKNLLFVIFHYFASLPVIIFIFFVNSFAIFSVVGYNLSPYEKGGFLLTFLAFLWHFLAFLIISEKIDINERKKWKNPIFFFR